MKYFFALICFVLLTACGEPHEIALDDNGNEKFEDFYVKFHADSSFQMARIEFPMLKEPEKGERMEFWEAEDWAVVKPVVEKKGEVESNVEHLGEVVRERVVLHNRFIIEFMYSLINKKWYLTEYSGTKTLNAFFGQEQTETPSATEEMPMAPAVNLEIPTENE